METRSRSKRPRSPEEDELTQPEGSPAASTSAAAAQPERVSEPSSSGLELSLLVKWTTGHSGKTRVNRLSLKQLENVEKLGGLSKGLMDRAFPSDSRPEYLTDERYYRWTPDEACLSYPMDVTKTEFKLVAMYDGWEYVILAHELGTLVEPEDRVLFVTVIEFESVAVVLGNLGIRVSLVAYPVVCVQKSFLSDIKQQLQSNPDFKGILS